MNLKQAFIYDDMVLNNPNLEAFRLILEQAWEEHGDDAVLVGAEDMPLRTAPVTGR